MIVVKGKLLKLYQEAKLQILLNINLICRKLEECKQNLIIQRNRIKISKIYSLKINLYKNVILQLNQYQHQKNKYHQKN
jgi:hypothetical protein